MTQKLIKNPTTETTTKEQFIEKTGLIPCYFISFGKTSDPFELGTPIIKETLIDEKEACDFNGEDLFKGNDEGFQQAQTYLYKRWCSHHKQQYERCERIINKFTSRLQKFMADWLWINRKTIRNAHSIWTDKLNSHKKELEYSFQDFARQKVLFQSLKTTIAYYPPLFHKNDCFYRVKVGKLLEGETISVLKSNIDSITVNDVSDEQSDVDFILHYNIEKRGPFLDVNFEYIHQDPKVVRTTLSDEHHYFNREDAEKAKQSIIDRLSQEKTLP